MEPSSAQLGLPHHSSLTLQGKKKKTTLSYFWDTFKINPFSSHPQLLPPVSRLKLSSLLTSLPLSNASFSAPCGCFHQTPASWSLIVWPQSLFLLLPDTLFTFFFPSFDSRHLHWNYNWFPTEPCLKYPTIFILSSIRNPFYITTSCLKLVRNTVQMIFPPPTSIDTPTVGALITFHPLYSTLITFSFKILFEKSAWDCHSYIILMTFS